MATPFKWRRQRGGAGVIQSHSLNRRIRVLFTRKYVFRYLLSILAVIAIIPPVYFHFSLRRFHQLELKKCSWLNNPPLVCAHGGDASKAFPNTMAAYNIALRSQVDCIEIDVSRSADGVLLALHDRDLQQLSGNSSSKVGYLSAKEIKELAASHNIAIPTMEDALQLISSSVQKVVVDAKIGPPSYEKELAHDLISVVKKTRCKNCVIWAKSDNLVLDVVLQSSDMTVGYIVMMNFSTGVRTKLVRMRAADVVGIYHGLVDESAVKILHRMKKKIYAWTVDEEAAMHKMLTENVDAIITSDPSLLQSSMRDVRKKCLVDGFSIQGS
ncbi:glycerophosphodiester phosphodiesterase GDPD4-like [Bidens hawaiensis]|uniref:glycerophosphodiester phosphodiesterase GDPD4-like n=1 Tax=Bidens hawaiensis TaxID=980011 RepID=UPI0040493599